MAQPAGTHSTNDMVGIRESLADVIYDISPTETPFLSAVAQTDVSARLHEWQTDALAAAANNAAIEGDNAPATVSTPTVKVNNRTQISTKDARVSGSARAVDTAGRADELDYQVLKRGRELKRDMETALLANKAKVTGSDVLASELGGIGSWIKTNTDFGATGANPTGDGSNARTDGTLRGFTEAQLKIVLRKAWDAGGTPDHLMVGAFNRQVASTFGAATKFQKAEERTIRASFDVYDSDFGELKIVPNRFQRPRDALVLQMDMWQVAFLPGRNFAQFPLAKTGDSDARQLLSEYTLVSKQEAANGAVFDLTSS